MYEKGFFRPPPPWGWGKALRPPRYVWNASGVPDDDDEYADPAPAPEPPPPPEPELEPDPDSDDPQAIAAMMRRARLRWQAERLLELQEFFERERAWQELRNSISAFRMRYGCGMPSAEHLEVFRQLYPGRSGTACNGGDLMAWGRSGRLDPGYTIPNKIS
jgi:hypothetical protein